jgi:hypothetical protein
MEHTSQACSLPLQYNWLCRVVSSLHSIKLGQIPKGKASKIHEPRTIGKQKNFKRDVIYLLTQCRSSVRMGLQTRKELIRRSSHSNTKTPKIHSATLQTQTQINKNSQSPRSLLGLPDPDFALPKASKSTPALAAMAYALAFLVT